jgi:hypothetical protein
MFLWRTRPRLSYLSAVAARPTLPLEMPASLARIAAEARLAARAKDP